MTIEDKFKDKIIHYDSLVIFRKDDTIKVIQYLKENNIKLLTLEALRLLDNQYYKNADASLTYTGKIQPSIEHGVMFNPLIEESISHDKAIEQIISQDGDEFCYEIFYEEQN